MTHFRLALVGLTGLAGMAGLIGPARVGMAADGPLIFGEGDRYTVPSDGSVCALSVSLAGGNGGSGYAAGGSEGGRGGRIGATVTVVPGEEIAIWVGSPGVSGPADLPTDPRAWRLLQLFVGGLGGVAGTPSPTTGFPWFSGGSGGGSSSVSPVLAADSTAPHWHLIAGGGGGGGGAPGGTDAGESPGGAGGVFGSTEEVSGDYAVLAGTAGMGPSPGTQGQGGSSAGGAGGVPTGSGGVGGNGSGGTPTSVNNELWLYAGGGDGGRGADGVAGSGGGGGGDGLLGGGGGAGGDTSTAGAGGGGGSSAYTPATVRNPRLGTAIQGADGSGQVIVSLLPCTMPETGLASPWPAMLGALGLITGGAVLLAISSARRTASSGSPR